MVAQILDFLKLIVENIILTLHYPGVMLASAIESACIPLPSEVIFPFSGFLVAQGKFSFFWVMFYGMLGQVLGSLLAYAIGWYGALPLLIKYGKYVLIKEKEIHHAQEWFHKYGEGAVFWGRLLPVIRTFISLPAGVARMNLGKFLAYTIVGCAPWLWVLTFAGVKLEDNWERIKDYTHALDAVVILGILALIAWWIISIRRKKPAA